ncbi:hypothetical protein [Nostoc sp.]
MASWGQVLSGLAMKQTIASPLSDFMTGTTIRIDADATPTV